MKALLPPSRRRPAGPVAFSLVEVTMAIGVLSFCLLGVVGLLPLGINTMKASRERAAAANCLEQIADAIRSAVRTDTAYAAPGAYASLAWSLGGGAQTATWTNLSLGGVPAAAAGDQRLASHVEIRPPADLASPGAALISVAWPSRAVWSVEEGAWKNAGGSVSTWLVFLPNR